MSRLSRPIALLCTVLLGLISSLTTVPIAASASAPPAHVSSVVKSEAGDPFATIVGSLLATYRDGSTGPLLYGGYPDSEVNLVDTSGNLVSSVMVGTSGNWRINVDPGTYTLKFQQEAGYAQQYFDAQWWNNSATQAGATYFTVGAGNTLSADATLQLSPTIAGHVTGAISNTNDTVIYVYAMSPDGKHREAITDTDSDGNYFFDHLTAGTYVLRFDPSINSGGSVIYAPQWYDSQRLLNTANTITVVDRQELTGIDQTLQVGSTITGKMTDSHGRPLSGTAVVYDAGGSGDNKDTFERSATVEPDGTYTVVGLPTGDFKVGFTTVVDQIMPSLVANKQGLSAGATPLTSLGDAYPGGSTTSTGSLAPSTPYIPQWYLGAASYASANTVTINTPGQTVSHVDAALVYDPSFVQTWPGEHTGANNPSESGCQCSHADPINTATGDYYETATDVTIPGVGPDFKLTRNYSSIRAVSDGPFGYGSTSNFGMRVNVLSTDSTTSVPTKVAVVQENGSIINFTLTANGDWAAPPRVLATLTEGGDQSWTLTRKDGEAFDFNSSGILTTQRDRNNNEIHYVGGAEPTQISASGGRILTLTWYNDHVANVTDSAGRTAYYSYDGSGNLASFTDLDGRATTFGYDSNHRLNSVTKATGGVIATTYDDSGRAISQTDPLGRTTTFVYDIADADVTTTTTQPDGHQIVEAYHDGQLTSSKKGADSTYAAATTFEHDDAGNVTQKTNPLGKATTFTYDARGNLLTQTDPLHHTTTWTYDDNNLVLSKTDPLGRVTSESYDSAGNHTAETLPGGENTTWTYNSDGTVANRTDGKGKVTSFAYDDAGRVIRQTDPDIRKTWTYYNAAGNVRALKDSGGNTTHISLDAEGQVTAIVDPTGARTSYTYDVNGNRLTVKDPLGQITRARYNLADERTSTTDASGKTTHTSYTTAGLLKLTVDPNGGRTVRTYDALERPKSIINPDGNRATMYYNRNGQVVKVLAPSGASQVTGYDAAGRKISSTDADGNKTTFSYDAADEPISTTDPLGRVTTQAYTPNGLLQSVTYPGSSVESYTYDADGSKIAFVNADGATTTYAYDKAELLVTKTEPGSKVTSYAYDTAGRLSQVTDPASVASVRTYDAASRIIGLDLPGTADDVAYAYDANGQRIRMTDSTGTSSYTYTPIGKMASETNGDGQTIAFGYDDAGHQKSITYPGSHTVSYAYDPAGLMTSLTDWSSKTTSFTWTTDGQLKTQTTPDGSTESRSYNSRGLLTDIQDVNGSSTYADYGFGYDVAGQLTARMTTDALHAGTTDNYGYDGRGQITTTSPTTAYSSSAAGLVMATAGGDALTYDASQQLTSTSNAVAATSSAYTYDGAGDRTQAVMTTAGGSSTTTYGYNDRNELESANGPSGLVTYTVDGDGLRQSRTDSAGLQKFLWDTSSSIPLLLSEGADSYIYGPTASPIAQVDGAGSVEYLHGDNLGSVRTVTNSSGDVVSTSSYDAYGQRDGHSGSSNCAIGFTGNWTDSATSLVYLRARDYDPATSQFLSRDLLVALTAQPYAYAHNNPLLEVDLLGLDGGSVGEIAGWISFGAGIAGLICDATGVGAPVGAVLEVISLAANGVASLDDCFGTFGGDKNMAVCALDGASFLTAGAGEIAADSARGAAKVASAFAKTGETEYSAAVWADRAAAREADRLAIDVAGSGIDTLSRDISADYQLLNSQGGTGAEASFYGC